MKTQTESKILDIATGLVYVAMAATKPQYPVIGLDLSDAMLKKVKQLHAYLEFIQ